MFYTNFIMLNFVQLLNLQLVYFLHLLTFFVNIIIKSYPYEIDFYDVVVVYHLT